MKRRAKCAGENQPSVMSFFAVSGATKAKTQKASNVSTKGASVVSVSSRSFKRLKKASSAAQSNVGKIMASTSPISMTQSPTSLGPGGGTGRSATSPVALMESFAVKTDDAVKFVGRTPIAKRSPVIKKSPMSVQGSTRNVNLTSREQRKKAKDERFKQNNENRYSWLVDLKDAQGRRPADEAYDGSTLYIPQSAYAALSPFEQQFWDIKRAHFDMVIFFKKGKFYELYENDADVGHKHLGLKLTDRVNMRMAGIPEMSFNTYAARLVQLGFKIGRVDQVESMFQSKRRLNQQPAKKRGKDSIINRELTQVLTVGTLVDPDLLTATDATYLMAIYERPDSTRFGTAYVDAATGSFTVDSFQDDHMMTQLETLLLQIRPKEVLFRRESMRPRTLAMIKRILPGVSVSSGGVGNDSSWDPEAAWQSLRNFFGSSIPEVLLPYRHDVEASSAMGATISYLKTLMLDKDVLSLRDFRSSARTGDDGGLIMDGKTLANLEILFNSDTQTEEGSLLQFLDRCASPFGRRVLVEWLCRPLGNVQYIDARLDAVEFLVSEHDTLARLRDLLSRLPDIPRLLARARSGRIRLKNYVDLLRALSHSQTIAEYVEEVCSTAADRGKTTGLLAAVGLTKHGGVFPDMVSVVEGHMRTLDLDKAVSEGVVVPEQGFDNEYDRCASRVEEIKDELQACLQESRKYFKDRSIKYRHLNKEHYQLEIPASTLRRVPPGDDYQLLSSTKGFCRYWTPQIRELVGSIKEAEDDLKHAQRGVFAAILARFSADHDIFSQAASCLAQIDCLCSIAKACCSVSFAMCRPRFVEDGSVCKPVVRGAGIRHPCAAARSTDAFIPNDVVLGDKESPSLLLLTGANMAGKSTLLRQVGLCVVLAQLGSLVPADSFSLSTVDRIFTRCGASDQIMSGQSTFMVEMLEASLILRNATPRSLVIVDELGRGTSTYDGFALSHAVLSHLALKLQCRTLFSTHYHTLATEWELSDAVCAMHMACLVGENADDVIFLYKMKRGVSPRSYGMNVAALAGIPPEIIKKADSIALNMAESCQLNARRRTALLRRALERAVRVISNPKSASAQDIVEMREAIDEARQTA